MSFALVKLQRRGQMVLPRLLREEAGVHEGALLKVAVVKGGQFLLTPQVAIDRSIVTNSRRNHKQLLRGLAVALADLRSDAHEMGLDKMPISRINRAVSAARRDLRKKRRRRGK